MVSSGRDNFAHKKSHSSVLEVPQASDDVVW